MCTNYVSTQNQRWVKSALGIEMPASPFPREVFPGYSAPIVLRRNAGEVRCEIARFGLIPYWAKDIKFGRYTYNARSETVAQKPSFRTPWRRRQFCLVLADAIYEPCYSSGRPVRYKIQRPDQGPLALAGLWDEWLDRATGEQVLSFTMLTVNADAHALMSQFHKPGDEKRSVVMLEEPLQWLSPELHEPLALLRPPGSPLESFASPLRS